MKRRLVGTLLFCALLPFVMGAGIDFSPNNPVPNPGGKANWIEANGQYSLLAGETYGRIDFLADLDGSNPVQTTTKTATPNSPAYKAEVYVAAAKYNCASILYYVDNKGKSQQVATNVGGNPKIQVTVK